jgi:hypothetical protein
MQRKMSRKLRKWLSLKDVAHKSRYTPRQLQRILRSGPPKKLASYCDPQLLAAMFHHAFRVGRIKSGGVLRFEDTPQLRWLCLFLKLHKDGVSPQKYWTAYYAHKLIRPLFEPFDYRRFSEMSERRRAMLAVLATDEGGFVPREKFSEMAEEFFKQINKAAKEKEKRESGEERQEEHWKEIAERDYLKEI